MKLILIDDNALVRSSMSALLEREKDVDIVGEAQSMEDAVKIISDKNPDIALLNSKVDYCNNLSIIKQINDADVACKFIIIANSFEELNFKVALKIGAHGYILKSVLPEELLHAIRSVYKGKKYYDPAIVERALKYDDRQETGLTPRELEVLRELGKGMSNMLISENLQISQFTVKKHISNIFTKLNVRGRTEAALYANSIGRSE